MASSSSVCSGDVLFFGTIDGLPTVVHRTEVVAIVAFMPSPHRIAFVIPTLDRSGAEKQLTLLARGLPRDEFAPHVVTLTRGGPYEVDLAEAGIPVTLIGKRWKADPFACWRLRQTLRTLQPALVHTWLFAASAYARLALGRRPPCPIIVSERCVDSWKSGWQLRLDRWLASRTDACVGNSASVVEFYRQQGLTESTGWTEERLRVIPNGVETPTAPSIDRAARLRQWNLPEDSFVVGYVGRLAAQKRVQDLIFAVETLRHIRPQVQLVLIGDGPERERLERFAVSVGGAAHVHFLGHREDATACLPHLDVFALASSFEGMSNSLMEAMAAGRPVLVSDISANRELVTHERTGLVVKLGDAVGFMQFLRRLIDEPDWGPRLGAAAKQRMTDEFSVAKMIERHVGLYRQLLGRSK